MNEDLGSVVAIAIAVGVVLGTIGLVLASFGPALVGHFTIEWARLCSLPWPRTVRDRYAAEMRSHVHQHFNDPDMFGRTPGQMALRLLVDTTTGMPRDVLWALQGIADQVRRRLFLRRGGIDSPATLELEPVVEMPSNPMDLEVAVQNDDHRVSGFLPSTHGLHFANRFAPGPTIGLGPFDTRWLGGLGDASVGHVAPGPRVLRGTRGSRQGGCSHLAIRGERMP